MKQKDAKKAYKLALNEILDKINTVLPVENHITPVNSIADLESLRAKVKKLQLNKAVPSSNESKASTPLNEDIIKQFLKALASIATNAWRAKNKMIDPENKEPKNEMKRPYRHIESILNAMGQIDITIIDWTGRPYDAGHPIKPISFEEVEGLKKDEIIETISPTILWRSSNIQIGEVVIGTPHDKSKKEKIK